jgi:predicted ester cyclase
MSSYSPLDQFRTGWEESWNQGKLDALDPLFTTGFTPHHPLNPVMGAEGVKQFVAVFQEAFSDLEFTIKDMIAAGDRLVIRWEMHGTHTRELMGLAPTRKRACLTGISIYRLVEGQAAESWDQVDILNLLSQLNVLPT